MWLSRLHGGVLLSVQQIWCVEVKSEESSTIDGRPTRDCSRRSEEESLRLDRCGNAIRNGEKEGKESVVDGEPRTCSSSISITLEYLCSHQHLIPERSSAYAEDDGDEDA